MIDEKAKVIEEVLIRQRQYLYSVTFGYLTSFREPFEEANDIFNDVALYAIERKEQFYDLHLRGLLEKKIVFRLKDFSKKRRTSQSRIVSYDTEDELTFLIYDMLDTEYIPEKHPKILLEEIVEMEQNCIDLLSTTYKELYRLRRFNKFAYATLARIFNKSEESLRQRFHRASEMIIECIRENICPE